MDLTDAILELIVKASTELQSHMRVLLEEAQKSESGTSKQILEDIINNCDIAKKNRVPICQDTGVLNFFVQKGRLFRRGNKQAYPRGSQPCHKRRSS